MANKKINTEVFNSEMINLQTVFPEMPPTTYILTDVINHHGDGVNLGHYTETNIEQSRCFDGLRNPKFDLVDAASCDKYKKTGYIFFYKRLDLPEQGASGDSLSNLGPLNLSTPEKSCRDNLDVVPEAATPYTPQPIPTGTSTVKRTFGTGILSPAVKRRLVNSDSPLKSSDEMSPGVIL